MDGPNRIRDLTGITSELARIGRDHPRLFLNSQGSLDSSAYELISAALKSCRSGPVANDVRDASIFIRVWGSLYPNLQSLQRDSYAVEWVIEPEYRNIRQQAAMLLELFGYLPGVETAPALAKALTITDPRIRLFAVVSMLRLKESVDQGEMESIAECTEIRIILWERLCELGLQFLMPLRWAEPAELAASALSVWASSPAELGVPPEDIELMATYPVRAATDVLNGYLFRFREYPKPWTPGEGWMAGVAGPYRNGQPLASPWSEFDPWHSLPPDGHWAKLFVEANRCLAQLDPSEPSDMEQSGSGKSYRPN